MSQRRPPHLLTPAHEGEIQSFLIRLGEYCDPCFEEGDTDLQIIARLGKASRMFRIRRFVSDRYFAYLGINEGTIKAIDFLSIALPVAGYLLELVKVLKSVGPGHFETSVLTGVVGIPVVLVLAIIIDSLGRSALRLARFGSKPHASRPPQEPTNRSGKRRRRL